MEKDLYTHLEELEMLRKKANTGSKIVQAVMAMVTIAVVGGILLTFTGRGGGFNFPISIFVLSFIAAVILMLTVIVGGKDVVNLNVKYKELIVEPLLKELYDNVSYDREGGFSSNQLEVMTFCNLGRANHTEDYISADFNNVHFQRCDLKSYTRIRSNNNSHTHIYFKGRVYQIVFDKEIASGIQIRSKNFPAPELPGYLSKNDKVKMGYSEFSDIFDVFATNSQDAFNVLTPRMMEGILEVNKKFKSMVINIIGNRIILAGNSDYNSLEPDWSKPILYAEEKQRMRKQLEEIEIIIKCLRLV